MKRSARTCFLLLEYGKLVFLSMLSLIWNKRDPGHYVDLNCIKSVTCKMAVPKCHTHLLVAVTQILIINRDRALQMALTLRLLSLYILIMKSIKNFSIPLKKFNFS